jgi:hypothetical protein
VHNVLYTDVFSRKSAFLIFKKRNIHVYIIHALVQLDETLMFSSFYAYYRDTDIKQEMEKRTNFIVLSKRKIPFNMKLVFILVTSQIKKLTNLKVPFSSFSATFVVHNLYSVPCYFLEKGTV